MTLPFEERLKRIAPARGGLAPEPVAILPSSAPVPMSLAEKKRMQVVNAALLGFLWMFPTGWVLGEHDLLHAILAYSVNDGGDISMAVNVAWYAALGSFLMFVGYFRIVLMDWWRVTGGISDWTMYASGIVSGLIGYGPLQFFARYAESHAQRFG